ncbi:MAG: hypothetical protein ACOY3L_14570 [Pseudomonadota bacterium]
MSFLSWHGLVHRQERRSLASAFVGEIVAVLRAIEEHDVLNALEQALRAGAALPLPRLTLPHLAIYEADAGKLDRLPAPLPRQIAYFYTRILSLQSDLAELGAEPASGAAAEHRSERIRHMLSELREALDLADDILRELRPLLETHGHGHSHLHEH